MTLRGELKDFVYNIKQKKSDEEIEVIRLKDFMEVLDKKYPSVFDDDYDFILEQILSLKDKEQNIPFSQLVKVMNSYGLPE